MRKTEFKSVLGVAVLGLVLAILSAGCGSSSGRSAGPGTGEGIFVSQELGTSTGAPAERVPDQIMVKFKPGTAETNIQSLNRSQGAAVKRIVAEAFVVLKVPASRSVDDLVESYRANADVEWAEPDYIAHALGSPNDPYFSYQWHLFDYGTPSGKSVSNFGVQAPSAWNASTGSNVTVAIVDTGAAYENYTPYAQAPDLAGTTFVPGYDFVNGDTHPNDDESHGTHVTGTVAQTTNNSYGVAGIAFNAKIMPVKVLDSSGSGSYSNIAAGIRWAADNGAKIINMSLGGSSGSQALQEAIDHAQGGGVLVVCAAGNNGSSNVLYPARYPWCIAVGATRFDGARVSYSNYGSDLDLVAPGGDTSVDQNGDGYGDGVLQQTFASGQPTNFGFWFFQGTSMASPHVAGVAALVWAAHPEYSASDVRNALEKTAKDLGASGWDQYYGNGLVNAAAAVAYGPGDTQAPVVTITDPANGSTVSGTITVRATATDNVGVTSVGYRIDSGATVPMSNTGSDTYEAAWNTTTASNGSHSVTVQASDAAGNVGIAVRLVTVSNVAPPNTIHVAAIVMALQKTGSSTAASATVTIVDNNGSPVRSAAVSGTWSGLTSGSSSGTTSKTGTVKLTSKSVRNAHGTFTFTVTSVSRSGYTYNPAGNVETSDFITVP